MRALALLKSNHGRGFMLYKGRPGQGRAPGHLVNSDLAQRLRGPQGDQDGCDPTGFANFLISFYLCSR